MNRASGGFPERRGHPHLIVTVFAASAYAGKCAEKIRDDHGIRIGVALRPGEQERSQQGERHARWPRTAAWFRPDSQALGSRVVERTNGWSDHSRRLSNEYDRRVEYVNTLSDRRRHAGRDLEAQVPLVAWTVGPALGTRILLLKPATKPRATLFSCLQ